jgi:hypothetical protein
MMQHHVLEECLDVGSLQVQGIDETITEAPESRDELDFVVKNGMVGMVCIDLMWRYFVNKSGGVE